MTARSGLRLRSGPGTGFEAKVALPTGTRLFATLDPADPRWARVDLEGDGLTDGFVFAAYISPA